MNTFGFIFESLAIRDLRVYAEVYRGNVYHYRDETGLEVDAIIELRDGRWMGSKCTKQIDHAASSLLKLRDKLTEQRASQNIGLIVLTDGELSYTRQDGVALISFDRINSSIMRLK